MANVVKAVAMAALSASASAVALDGHHEHIVPMPMHEYRSECWKESNLRIIPSALSLLQHDNVPGAGVEGMKDFKPFQRVEKDGFLQVDCVKDYMYYSGDKFGGNKHDYKLGPVSDVSIVHYDAFVAKEDQKEMTQTVCFEFCRTVPNMGFFGLVNGRNCYCTPYFEQAAGDSSQCDSVCPGDNTIMCGGKSKSSIFAMHMCASTGDDLMQRSSTAGSIEASLSTAQGDAKTLGDKMQTMGTDLQKVFGQVGDSGASGLMQDAKVYAGTVLHTAADAKDAAGALDTLKNKASGLNKGANYQDPDTVTKAERIMEDIDEAVAEGEVAEDKLEKVMALASPGGEKAGAAKQYYPVMYFVDKATFEKKPVPTTCAGGKVGEPIAGVSEDGCASACDASVADCVGYQFFEKGGDSLCFLFSRFNTGFYYTGCKGAPSITAKCQAKLNKFSGLPLKPNPSGKCKQCFKELTKANRCY